MTSDRNRQARVPNREAVTLHWEWLDFSSPEPPRVRRFRFSKTTPSLFDKELQQLARLGPIFAPIGCAQPFQANRRRNPQPNRTGMARDREPWPHHNSKKKYIPKFRFTFVSHCGTSAEKAVFFAERAPTNRRTNQKSMEFFCNCHGQLPCSHVDETFLRQQQTPRPPKWKRKRPVERKMPHRLLEGSFQRWLVAYPLSPPLPLAPWRRQVALGVTRGRPPGPFQTTVMSCPFSLYTPTFSQLFVKRLAKTPKTTNVYGL